MVNENESKFNVEGSINLSLKNGKNYEFALWHPVDFKALFSIEYDINFARNVVVDWLDERGFKSHEIADIKISINYS